MNCSLYSGVLGVNRTMKYLHHIPAPCSHGSCCSIWKHPIFTTDCDGGIANQSMVRYNYNSHSQDERTCVLAPAFVNKQLCFRRQFLICGLLVGIKGTELGWRGKTKRTR